MKDKIEYGEDIIGWLSYICHKKETMKYIESLEEKVKKLEIEKQIQDEKIGLLTIKLKDKQKTIRELKKEKGK